MKVTDKWPMLYVVVSDILEQVERFDKSGGRKWWNPFSWEPRKLPSRRICCEIEVGLQSYGQPWVGVTTDLCDVYVQLGYSNRGYPLNDELEQPEWRAGTKIGDGRRKLLKELHAYLESLEFGTVAPISN